MRAPGCKMGDAGPPIPLDRAVRFVGVASDRSSLPPKMKGERRVANSALSPCPPIGRPAYLPNRGYSGTDGPSPVVYGLMSGLPQEVCAPGTRFVPGDDDPEGLVEEVLQEENLGLGRRQADRIRQAPLG